MRTLVGGNFEPAALIAAGVSLMHLGYGLLATGGFHAHRPNLQAFTHHVHMLEGVENVLLEMRHESPAMLHAELISGADMKELTKEDAANLSRRCIEMASAVFFLLVAWEQGMLSFVEKTGARPAPIVAQVMKRHVESYAAWRKQNPKKLWTGSFKKP